MPKLDSNKSQVLGVRIEDELLQKLEQYALNTNESKSHIARKAIIEWMEVLDHSRNTNQIIISKKMFQNCLDLADETSLQKFAQEIVHQFDENLIHVNLDEEGNEIIKMLFQILIHRIGPSGQNWFQHLEYNIVDNLLEIKGIHNISQKFSVFIKYFFLAILKSEINFEKITESSIYFKFKLDSKNK